MKLNWKEVAEGWKNDLFPAKELKDFIQEVSDNRLTICKLCPKQSDNAKVEGYKTIRQDLHCTVCKCPLIKKSKSLSSSCPENKWAAITSNEERFAIEEYIKNHETKEL
jgi:hypothetical protein